MTNLDFYSTKVKKPKDDVDLTEEQFQEFINCQKDIFYWLNNYAYVQNVGKELFYPREYQQRMIQKMCDSRYNIFNIGRQAGKSITIIEYLLWVAIFFPDERIGITSYKVSNVKDMMDRIKYTYENLPIWMKPAVTEYNKFSIVFDNDSFIVSEVTNSSTFRGKSLTKIMVDEFAHVKPYIADEFWGSLVPSIEAQGNEATTQIIIASTPNGTGNKYAELWFDAKSGENGFDYLEVEYDEVPGRDENFKKTMIAKLGMNKFLQEFCCHFISDTGTLINSRVLESLKYKEPEEEFGDLLIYNSDLKNRKIAIGCDVSEGVGKDYHTIQVIDIDSFEQVAEYKNNILPQTEFFKKLRHIIKFFFEEKKVKEIYYSVENNGIGKGIISLLMNSDDPYLNEAFFVSDPNGNKEGISITNSTKKHGCMKLKDFVEMGKLTLNSERLINELKFFVKRGNSFGAESGMHDDLCMGMVNLMILIDYMKEFEESVYDTVVDIEFEQDDIEMGIYF